eukprot:jgi/Bigna1/74569/fgenesh1_pg.29_\
MSLSLLPYNDKSIRIVRSALSAKNNRQVGHGRQCPEALGCRPEALADAAESTCAGGRQGHASSLVHIRCYASEQFPDSLHFFCAKRDISYFFELASPNSALRPNDVNYACGRELVGLCGGGSRRLPSLSEGASSEILQATRPTSKRLHRNARKKGDAAAAGGGGGGEAERKGDRMFAIQEDQGVEEESEEEEDDDDGDSKKPFKAIDQSIDESIRKSVALNALIAKEGNVVGGNMSESRSMFCGPEAQILRLQPATRCAVAQQNLLVSVRSLDGKGNTLEGGHAVISLPPLQTLPERRNTKPVPFEATLANAGR